jgi:hypothetical protein
MSKVAHRRALSAATNALVKTNAPTEEHYTAVVDALAQVFTDDVGVECQVVIKLTAEAAEKATTALSKEKP